MFGPQKHRTRPLEALQFECGFAMKFQKYLRNTLYEFTYKWPKPHALCPSSDRTAQSLTVEDMSDEAPGPHRCSRTRVRMWWRWHAHGIDAMTSPLTLIGSSCHSEKQHDINEKQKQEQKQGTGGA